MMHRISGAVQRLAEGLQSLGADRVEAFLVAHLALHGESQTKDIVDATPLRQPEVSVGMRALAERGWVVQTTVPRRGKGRPMNRYHLKQSRTALADHYADYAERTVQAARAALTRVREALDLARLDLADASIGRHERHAA